ncbi:hypothetical protein [Micromonospora sp. NPDC005413]
MVCPGCRRRLSHPRGGPWVG